MTRNAHEIYQQFLDEMAHSLLVRDADSFCARIFLPHVIETETSRFVVEDMAASHRHFTGFADALHAQNVDEYVRIAKNAHFEDGANTRIRGNHESFMMSGGKLVVPKFANEVALELRDGIWGSTVTRHFARYVAWPDILPRGGGAVK